MPGTWCALPFSAVTFYADGSVSPCCKHVDRDQSQNFYKIDPNEALDSPLFKRLQKQFLNGEKPAACIKCWNAEEQGLRSFRLQNQDRYLWARENSGSSGTLKMIDVAFGNTCNAACLTCDSVSSHKWLPETQELMKIEGNPFERWIYKSQSHLTKWTSDQLREVEVALFDQSESFLQPGFKSLIAELKRSGNLKEMSLSLSTNGSYWPNSEILDDLAGAKSLEIQISVDGTNSLFNYL